jgi:Ca2+/Na+ antiporter
MPDRQTIRAAGRQAKSSLVAPVARFSSVIWLQVTGVFFALVAFTMGSAAWRTRAALHSASGSHDAIKLYAYLAVCALFTYFTVSSFVRAARR